MKKFIKNDNKYQILIGSAIFIIFLALAVWIYLHGQ